jgi:uncharacterized membrane protein
MGRMAALAITAATLRVVLAAVFLVMGALHFVPAVARGMRAMIPPVFRRPPWPSPAILVVFTGVCELAGGVGLLIPGVRWAAGPALAVFLVAVFPANAYAATQPERFGRTAVPFWPRLAAQVVLIALVLFAAFW